MTASEIRRAGLLRQVTIQSFDWGALKRMRQEEPRLPLVALTNYDFLQVGQPGASPWLGGLDIDTFGGDPIRAIRTFGASAFSPVHGFPQNGTVADPGYQPYVTRAMVRHAHAYGIKVIPWTVDDTPTMAELLDDGVDGLITDYPDRLRTCSPCAAIGCPGHTTSADARDDQHLARADEAVGSLEPAERVLDLGPRRASLLFRQPGQHLVESPE